MAIAKEELDKEKKYLKEVLKVIKEKINTDTTSIEKQKTNIYEMKKFMWDNLSDYTDEERMIALHDRDTEVSYTNERIKSLVKLKKSLLSPYFGKIVFDCKTFNETTSVYIGINTVEKDLDFYVYDWRSPISSMYYNYENGPAEYESPSGTIKGEITKKRQFKIENGQLVRCFDSSINIEDDFLQEVLANQSSEKMQNIVSTIQKEQNEIIRNVKDNFLIVQGIAGSGKTSVALHRIAYLLYKQKDLDSKNVLIFSPNNLFSYYISEVLPELGEENVSTTTFFDFSKVLLKASKVESFTDYLDRVYQIKNPDIKKTIMLKESDEFKKILDKFYEVYVDELRFKRYIYVNETEEIAEEELDEMFHERWGNKNISTRLEFITESLCDKYKLNRKKNYKRIYNQLVKSLNKPIDEISIYNELMKYMNVKTIDRKNLKYEDLTPLLYLNFKINGYPNYSHIKQVVIDEVQDYSKLQIEMLNNIFSNASFTVLGDVNQTINPCYEYSSLEELKDMREKSNYLELNKTYRSSEEIIEYSNKVLGLNNVCAIRHNNGIEVKETDVDYDDIKISIPKYLKYLNNHGFKKNAIITKNKEEAVLLAELLKDVDNLSLVKEGSNITSNNIIIPSYMSKGLEFNGVILYTDPNNPYTEEEKKLYYVVLSRAQNELYVCNQPKVRKKTK